MIILPKNDPVVLSKEMLEKEKKNAEKEGNLAWPISPEIYLIPKREK